MDLDAGLLVPDLVIEVGGAASLHRDRRFASTPITGPSACGNLRVFRLTGHAPPKRWPDRNHPLDNADNPLTARIPGATG